LAIFKNIHIAWKNLVTQIALLLSEMAMVRHTQCGIVDTKLRGDFPSARGQPFKILMHPTQFSTLI